MRRSWAREGQIEPLAALAAVSVVALALATYAGAFAGSIPEEANRNEAQTAADRVERAVTVGGVVDRSLLSTDAVEAAAPDGYHLNVTLVTRAGRVHAGPAAPATADGARRRVAARTDDAGATPGRLEVRVWS